MFDHPLWREKPIQTAWRLATCKLRQRIPGANRVVIAYDNGRARMEVDVHTGFGYTLYRYGHQEPEIDLIRALLSPGGLFVDGGAHVGLFTLVAASAVGPTGQVIAFEPAAETRRQLERNVALSNFAWVRVSEEALADCREARRFIAFSEQAWGSSSFAPPEDLAGGQVETVMTTTLDEAIPDSLRARLRLIKLDLEGAEYAALQGARELLGAYGPDLLIELEPDNLRRQGASPAKVADLLGTYGYQLFQVSWDARGAVRLDSIEPAQGIAEGRPNAFATTDLARVKAAGIRIG
jgi:FkbM family methyltransferase